MSLFFLEAYVHVNKDKIKEYEGLSTTLNQGIEQTEPGMLIHVQTRISETEQEVVYRWLEVFSSYDDLQRHLQNEHAQDHMQKIGNGILSKPVEVKVYCDWTAEQKEPWLQLPGFKVEFAGLVNGYFR